MKFPRRQPVVAIEREKRSKERLEDFCATAGHAPQYLSGLETGWATRHQCRCRERAGPTRVARSDSIPYLTIRDIRRLFNGIWIYLDHPHQLSVPGIYQMAKWPLPRLTRMALEPAGSTPYTMHVRHESAHVVAVALVRERRQRRPILGHW